MTRWSAFPNKTDLFRLAVSHVSKMPKVPRSAVSDLLYCGFFLPLFMQYLYVESGTSLTTTKPSTSSATSPSTTTATFNKPTSIQTKVSDDLVLNYVSTITDSQLAPEIIRSALDLLQFCNLQFNPSTEKHSNRHLTIESKDDVR